MPIEIKVLHRDDFVFYLALKVIEAGKDYVMMYTKANVYSPIIALLKMHRLELETIKTFIFDLFDAMPTAEPEVVDFWIPTENILIASKFLISKVHEPYHILLDSQNPLLFGKWTREYDETIIDNLY